MKILTETESKQIVENNIKAFSDYFKIIIKEGIKSWINVSGALVKEDVDVVKLLSKKNTSELLSKFFESKGGKNILNINGDNIKVKSAGSDRDVDLNFLFDSYELPFEIKVTSTTNQWMGGEYSDRTSYYLLVSWGLSEENKIEIFASILFLYKNEWSPGGTKFYATSFDTRALFNRKDRCDIFGRLDIEESPRKKNKN